MVEHVDVQDQKQLATWVAILYGFFLFLRKSNLVPVKRIHDPQHQLSQGDITYFDKVLIVEITWSKTNQFGERNLKVPVMEERLTDICPVDWLLFMVKRIPSLPQHNLFSFWQDGQILLVMYRDLTVFLRELLEKIGIENEHNFSSHSLHRGGTSHTFNRKIPERTIMTLENWSSDTYHKYIDVTLENRLKAWYLMLQVNQ